MRGDGLSLWYRFGYRVRQLLLMIFGPAQLDESRDPLRRLAREREAKVAAIRQARANRA